MNTALFRSDRTKRTGSRALVHVTGCPTCGGPLQAVTSAMPALFRHGGHGEVRVEVYHFCGPCRYAGGRATLAVNPSMYSAANETPPAPLERPGG